MSAPVQFERDDSVLARRGSKWVCATVISRAIGPVANPYTVQYDSDGKRADLAAGGVNVTDVRSCHNKGATRIPATSSPSLHYGDKSREIRIFARSHCAAAIRFQQAG